MARKKKVEKKVFAHVDKVPGDHPNFLGLYLKRLRIAAGMTQLEVAKEIGTTRFFVSGFECGKWPPPKRKIARLSEMYQVESKMIRLELVKWNTLRVRKKWGFK